MNRLATVTSKLQLTIPILIAKKVGIKSGEKVQVIEENGRIVITPLRQLVEDLAGSIEIPHHYKGKDINTLVKDAKKEYFHSKSKQ